MAKILLLCLALIGIFCLVKGQRIWCNRFDCDQNGWVIFKNRKWMFLILIFKITQINDFFLRSVLCTCSSFTRDLGENAQEKRTLSCPSDCSCQAYFGECCETIGFYLKYFAYVINLGNIPDHITDAEWRSAYPQFKTREELQKFFKSFTWPEIPCNSAMGSCPWRILK